MHDICDLGGCQTDLFQFLIMTKNCSGDIVIHHFAVIHDNDTVDIFRHVLHAVRYQHNCYTGLALQSLNLLKNLVTSFGIQSRGGLVQHQYLRFHGQYSGNGCPSLLSARELKGRLIKQFVRKTNLFQRIIGTQLYFLLVQTQILGSKAYICKHICFKQLMLRILKYKSHLTPQCFQAVLLIVDVLAIIINMTRGCFHKTVQMLNKRGFAGAGVPDDSKKLPVRNLQTYVIQRLYRKFCIRTVSIAHMI